MERRKALKNLALGMGYTIATPTLLGILNSCVTKETEYADWHAKVLSTKEKYIVTHLVDIIIPETETKGAVAVNVPQFVDLMLKDIESDTDRNQFKRGATLFALHFKEKYNKPILKGSKKEIENLLSIFFDIDPKEVKRLHTLQKQNIFNVPREQADEYSLYKFLVTLRSLTMFGFATSEYIGEFVLSYDPIPGKYDPDISVQEVGNAWSLR
ncbi:gluconate 2-dehydrogenase subunit 3 family protein [Ochrovirga pacifica]|uniref:gluconate 2-dehydrogenase subunit 3 family protein n=1 Tax=Ochrovirga pacifica TaxID=1042376 RepID=UPI0002557787|nr:gluconate 2-dehydrogenase subunit 3 family protein [Ochrovirga pacifica]